MIQMQNTENIMSVNEYQKMASNDSQVQTTDLLSLDYSNLGKVVRFHRRQNGLTQLQLANKAGVGKTMVFDLEKGKQSVRLNTLLKVLSALNINLLYKSPQMDSYSKTNSIN